VPAAAMAKVLQGDTTERTWTGHCASPHTIISGSVCLVNARTAEGAWSGAIQPVCLRYPLPCLPNCHLQLQPRLCFVYVCTK
jgi:hypothetical protein